jgi:hypothetical protein
MYGGLVWYPSHLTEHDRCSHMQRLYKLGFNPAIYTRGWLYKSMSYSARRRSYIAYSFPSTLSYIRIQGNPRNRSLVPFVTAEPSLSAAASNPQATSLTRKAGSSNPNRESGSEPFQDHQIVEVTFFDSVDECPNSRSLVGANPWRAASRSEWRMHIARHLPGSWMEYHILGSLSSPRKSMYLLSIDVLVRASFVGPPRSCSHSGGMIGVAVSGF